MSGSFQDTVLLIDAMAFRRAGLESFLTPWAREENVKLISAPPNDAHERLVEDNGCKMLIYNIGGIPPTAHEIVSEILVLHTMRPTASLVVFSDDESLESITATFNRGAQGYFSNSTSPRLVLQALSFILHGGSYFPPEAILRRRPDGTFGCAHQNSSRDAAPQAPSAPIQRDQASATGFEPSFRQQQSSLLVETAPGTTAVDNPCQPSATPIVATADTYADHHSVKPLLTERQQAVLACLCRGDPNKVIGRALGMTETTVKVHVREIMRKLRVVNRTQVAIAANQYGPGLSSAIEIVPSNSNMHGSSFEQQH